MINTLAVWDIDGTLADDALKEVIGSDAYYAPKVLRSLPPIVHTVDQARKLGEAKGVHLVVVTGRIAERDNGATEAWLDNHNIKHDEIMLRPESVPHNLVAEWKRKSLQRYLKMNFMPKKGEKFDPADGLKTVLVWEDTVANLIEFKTLLEPVGWNYTLFQVKGKPNGHRVDVWHRKNKRRTKHFNPVENEIEHEVINMEDVGSMNTFFEDGGNMV